MANMTYMSFLTFLPYGKIGFPIERSAKQPKQRQNKLRFRGVTGGGGPNPYGKKQNKTIKNINISSIRFSFFEPQSIWGKL